MQTSEITTCLFFKESIPEIVAATRIDDSESESKNFCGFDSKNFVVVDNKNTVTNSLFERACIDSCARPSITGVGIWNKF